MNETKPTCDICGCELVYETCDICGGSGYANVVGLDSLPHWCVPDEEEDCAYCDGVGGWWVCPDAGAHQVVVEG